MSDGSTAVSAPASASPAATAAYARIYEEQQPRLVAYARSLTRNAWTAEDLVAEAHFRVWRRLASGHEIDNVPAYLMTTVRHLAIAAGSAVRETPRDPHGEERIEADAHPHTDDPAEQVSSVDLVVRVLGQLPERWVKALWLAEAEGQPLAAIGPQLGTKEGATAVLLHRAREGMRQAFLRTQTGAPDDPACQVYWARMPAYVRGAATAKQSERLLGHVDACDDCRGRLAALMSANDRLPALVGPALLVFAVGGAGKFLLSLTAGSAGAASSAGGHGLLHGVRQAAVGGSKTQVAAAAGAVVAGAAALLLVLGPAAPGRIPAQRTPVADAPVAQVPVAGTPAGPPSTGARNGAPKKGGTPARPAGVRSSERIHTAESTAPAVPKPHDADEPTPAPSGNTAGGRTDDTPPATKPAPKKPTEPAPKRPTEPAPKKPTKPAPKRPTKPAPKKPTKPAPKGKEPAPPKTGGPGGGPKTPPSPTDPYPEPPAPTEQPPETPAPPAPESPENPAPPVEDAPETPAPPSEDTPPVAPPAQDPSPTTPGPTGTEPPSGSGPAAPPVSTPPGDHCPNPPGSAGYGSE
ncbi:sigma-70 family RNA polymerase sigma factor [Streptomyces sp. NPDC001351]|uniref:sigma-70 family RNA polymerase sigma factor n=1 Tax=Streptomyces sp. NPDC001351 TaxID=3364564 RepID=UPI00368220F0